MSNAKAISMAELNKLIDSAENKGDKKALLIVKSNLRKHEGDISLETLSAIVKARKKAEETAGEVYIDEGLEDLLDESTEVIKHLDNVILLTFGEEDDGEGE